jgi:hypothetical protein
MVLLANLIAEFVKQISSKTWPSCLISTLSGIYDDRLAWLWRWHNSFRVDITAICRFIQPRCHTPVMQLYHVWRSAERCTGKLHMIRLIPNTHTHIYIYIYILPLSYCLDFRAPNTRATWHLHCMCHFSCMHILTSLESMEQNVYVIWCNNKDRS